MPNTCTFPPETDCTDGACPAWWRGHDHGANGVVGMLQEDIAHGPNGGTVSDPELQKIREWIHVHRVHR